MALYDRSYRPWQGDETPTWSRFLIISRYSLGNVFTTRFTYNIFVAGLLMPLIPLVFIYIRANLGFLVALGITDLPLPAIDAGFFKKYMTIQSVFCWLILFLSGPDLFVHDLSQNGLVSYFTRPLSIWQYLLGKAGVIFGLHSLLLWVPMLVLFFFQAAVTDQTSYLTAHINIPLAILAAGFIFSLFSTLLAFAIIVKSRTRQRARSIMLVLFIVSVSADDLVNLLFRSEIGRFLNLNSLNSMLWNGLFGLESDDWLKALVVICILVFMSLLTLKRKLKPFFYLN